MARGPGAGGIKMVGLACHRRPVVSLRRQGSGRLQQSGSGQAHCGMRRHAGSLTYSENLHDLIVFFSIARGAADFFEADGRGLAVVHDYLWGEEDERETVAALELAGNGGSVFLASEALGRAAGAFEAMVDAMLEGKEDPEFQPRNQLEHL